MSKVSPNEMRLVSVGDLKKIHRDLDACQRVIWLAGDFDPAYCADAQARLKEIEGLIAQDGKLPNGLELKAEGEANRYCLLKDGRWLASILMNGELLVSQQEDFLRSLLQGGAEQAGEGGAV